MFWRKARRAPAVDVDGIQGAADVPKIKLAGFIDGFIAPRTLLGWAIDPNDKNRSDIRIVAQRAFGGHDVLGRSVPRTDLSGLGPGEYGFRVDLPEDAAPLEILSGALRIVASSGRSATTLPVEARLHSRLSLEAGSALLSAVQKRQEPVVVHAASRALKTVPEDQRAYIHQVINGNRGASGLQKPSSRDDISPISIPVGLKSGDMSATMGRNGFLFLTGGSNHAGALYDLDPNGERVRMATSKWLSLFEARKKAFSERGIAYIQMIIPEKASVLPDLLPGSTGKCTPILDGIESDINKSPVLDGSYVSALGVLLRGNRAESWRAVDSHISPLGARSLFNALANAMGYDGAPETPPAHTSIETGDLALRFFGTPLYEAIQYYEEQNGADSRKKTAEHMTSARHAGRKSEYENQNAPIKKRALAFGNSFMHGAGQQSSLSYWFSVNFSEYSFNFNPSVDWEYVDQVKPDYVICQTIERFLEMVPET